MAAPVRTGEELELHVDSLAYGGNGVARLNGFVVFVRRGLPGDTVRARVTKVKRGFAEATMLDVLSPGPDRVVAPCPHFGACGGCRFQDYAYDKQLEAKEAQVRDALTRLGRIENPPVEAIVPAASQYGYRNKLEYSFTQTEDGPALGFHRAGRWDEVLPIEVCLLTTELGNAIRDAVQVWAREEKLAAYDQGTQNGYLRHLVLREGRNTGPGARAARHRQGAEVRGGVPDRGAAPLPRGEVDPLGDQRHARRGDQPPDRAALGRGCDRGGDSRAALPRAAERVPPDEHRDGGERCTRSRATLRG